MSGVSFVHTVGVVEDVEDVLPLVVPDDVDHGRRVQRPHVEREPRRPGRRRVGAEERGGRSSVAAAPGAVDGRRRGADNRQQEGGRELGDDVGGRAGREAEQRQHAIAVARQPTHCSTPHRRRHEQGNAPGAARQYAPLPPPMAARLAADLRPCADGSADRTSLVAGQLQAASVPIAYRQLRHAAIEPRLGQTDGRTGVSLNAPPYGGDIITL